MKKVIAIIIAILVTCLLIAAIVSIDRARSMREHAAGGEQTGTTEEQTTEQPEQSLPMLEYTEYTGESHNEIAIITDTFRRASRIPVRALRTRAAVRMRRASLSSMRGISCTP